MSSRVLRTAGIANTLIPVLKPARRLLATSKRRAAATRGNLRKGRIISSVAGKAYLITHPETQLDREGRIHGRLDPPLSHSGSVKARQIARQLKSAKIARIHSSPRVRAKELAQRLSEETGAPVMIDPDLVPWDLASLSGAKTNSIRPLLEFILCSRDGGQACLPDSVRSGRQAVGR